MNKTKIVTVGIVVLFAVLTVSTASAAHATFFFDPQNTSVPEGYCNTREVNLMINITTDTPMDKVKGGQVGIRYNPSCMNITDHPVYGEWPGWGPNMDPWMSSWNAYPICCGDAGGMRYDMVMYGFDGSKEGIQHIATFTVHCNSTEYCETPMLFGYGKSGGQPCPIEVITRDDRNLYPDNVTFENGTFTCGTPAETYTISGYAKTEGGDPATKVNITNLNESKDVEDRPADYIDQVTGFYNLTLDVSTEVDTNDVLRIIACRDTANNESNCNVTDHNVTDYPPGEEANVNLTLNHFCRNPVTYPYRTWNASNWSGPAAMEMMIDHYLNPPWVPNQTVLNKTAIEDYNQDCNSDLEFVDPAGMKYTLNKYLYYPGIPDPFVAHYGIGSYADINDTLHYMCKWHYLGPGVAPAYGNYSNWMVVRGIHTNTTPTFTQGSYKIYGFWMNDPKDPGGIGENTYKSVEQWKNTYHKMLNVNPLDDYNGTYVAVCEPPEDDDVEVTLAKPKPRLATAITPMLAEEPMMLYGVKQLALEKVVKDDELLKIVKAAIDGVNEDLVPFDDNFAEVFAKTVPGKPMLVTSDNGDYYVVPFNVPVKERPPVKIMPVEIERPKISGLKKLERMKRVADRIELKPIPIEPIRAEKTLVVVIVDAEDGSFKEASWVENPAKYLPVSKIEAMKLALGEVLEELHVVAKKDARDLGVIQTRPTIELVYRDASPYYPDWKVTVNGKVFYVSQDRTVS